MASTSAAAIPTLVSAFNTGDRVFFKYTGAEENTGAEEYPGTVTDVEAVAVVKYKFEILDDSTPPSEVYPKGRVMTQRGDIQPFVSMNRRELIENSEHHVDLISIGKTERHRIKITEVIPLAVSEYSVRYTVKLDNPNNYTGRAFEGEEPGFKYVRAYDGALTLIAEGGRRRRRRRTQRRRTNRRRATKVRRRR